MRCNAQEETLSLSLARKGTLSAAPKRRRCHEDAQHRDIRLYLACLAVVRAPSKGHCQRSPVATAINTALALEQLALHVESLYMTVVSLYIISGDGRCSCEMTGVGCS